MKKAILTSIFVIIISLVGFGQKESGFKFSVGAELALPTGSFSNGYSFGIGGTAQIETLLQDKLYGTGTAGIIFYNGKSVGGGLKNSGLSIIPLRAGVKYFLTDGVYVGLQAGLGIINKGVGTAFAYSPLIGYEFKTNSGKAVDATLKYDAYSKNGTLGGIGFRVAYIL